MKFKKCYSLDYYPVNNEKIPFGKTIMIRDKVEKMLVECQSMFEYENLPDTITKKMLELWLFTKGFVVFFKHNDSIYCYHGTMGDKQRFDDLPSKAIVVNPHIDFDKSLEIDTECVVMWNDDFAVGILPILRRYATDLTENEITMRIANINMRDTSAFVAATQKDKESVELYQQKKIDGDMSVITTEAFLDDDSVQVRVVPTTTAGGTNHITQLIEHEVFLRSSYYNELGLQSQWNAKRESINSNEAELNEDMLLPFVDNMYKCRKEAVEKINKLFGTNIIVRKGSAWADNQKLIDKETNELEEKDEQEGEENE